MSLSYVNNWLTQLVDGVSTTSNTIVVTAEALSRLDFSGGRQYLLTVTASLDPTQKSQFEILLATGIDNSGGIAVQRALDGTSLQAWPSGSYVYCSITAGVLSALQANVTSLLAEQAKTTQALAALTTRVNALDGGGGESGTGLTDGDGNRLTDDNGNRLILGE